MYKVYVFDIDGTLLDTAPTILDCIERAIALSGLEIDNKAINQSLIGPKMPEIVDMLGISHKENKLEVVRHFRELYDNAPEPGTKFYPQGLSLLKEAQKETSNLFIATNKPTKPTEKLLKHFNLNCFRDVYTPNRYVDKTVSKTDMLREIIENNYFSPSDVLFVGDTKGDLEAANNAGCKFAFASYGYEKEKEYVAKRSEIILKRKK